MDVASSRPGCARCTTRFFTSRVQQHCRGFTLIELLVAVAILTILLSYAIPSTRSFIDGQRRISQQNDLVSTLYLARSEAIMRNSDVVVCKSNDGQTCISSGEWDQGWLVFEDQDGDRTPSADDAIIASHAPLNGTRLYYRAFGSNHYIVYHSQGITKTNGTYTFCDAAGAQSARALIIYKTGRVRSSNTRSDGTPLTCPP